MLTRGGAWRRLLAMAGLAMTAGTACAVPSLAATERGVLTVVAHNYRFQPDAIHLTAGQPVRLVLDNRDPVKHNISFRDLEPRVAVVTPMNGKQAIVFTPTKPGTYYLYCSEPGHEQLGMQGTAIVE
jgi:nitrite reductase (NO-forming)